MNLFVETQRGFICCHDADLASDRSKHEQRFRRMLTLEIQAHRHAGTQLETV